MLGLGLSIPQVAARGTGVGSGWVLSAGGVKAALDYDFTRNRAYQNGAISALSSLFTTSRASSILVGAGDGTVSTAGANAPAISDLGLAIYRDYTPRGTYSNDLTQAAWVKTNTAAAKDQIGPDGVVNSASSITATSANGTVLQSVTLGSAARRLGARVKRLTGSSPIQMTMDGGVTWTTVPVTSRWSRVSIPSQTLANPSFGFKIMGSGDSIAVAYVNLFDGLFIYPDALVDANASAVSASDVSLPQAARSILNSGVFTVFAVVADVGQGEPGPLLSANGTAQTLAARNGQYGGYLANSLNVLGNHGLTSSVTSGYFGRPHAAVVMANDGAGRSLSGGGAVPATDLYDALSGSAGAFVGLGRASGEYLNGRLLRLAVWPTRLSDGVIPTISDGYALAPLLMDGDSYTVKSSLYDLSSQVSARMPGRTINATAVGGSTLTQVKSRVLSASDKTQVLIVWDGYFNGYIGPVSDYVQMYVDMAAQYSKAVFIPPVSAAPTYLADVTTTEAIRAEMIARGLHVIDAAHVLSFFGDGSANDNADIAAGGVARSLVDDGLHLKPAALKEVSVAVQVVMADLGY